MEVKMIDTEKIKPSPFQTRRNFDEENLKGLADTYKRSGIVEILSVRPKDNGYFELISGERRLRAARIAGFKEVLCIVKELSNKDARYAQLIPNIQREDLDPLARAQAINSLMQEEDWKTIVETSRNIGTSQGNVSRWLTVLKMPVNIQKKILPERISMVKIQKIAQLGSESDKELIFEKASEEDLSQKRVFDIVDAFKEIDADETFTIKDKTELKTEIIEAEEFVESPKSIILKRKWEKEHSEKKNLQSIGVFALKLAKKMGNVAKQLKDLAGSWEYLPEEGKTVILSHLDELNEIREKIIKGGKDD